MIDKRQFSAIKQTHGLSGIGGINIVAELMPPGVFDVSAGIKKIIKNKKEDQYEGAIVFEDCFHLLASISNHIPKSKNCNPVMMHNAHTIARGPETPMPLHS